MELQVKLDELGGFSMRLVDAMREQRERMERRQRSATEILVDQMALLIPTLGNASFGGYDPPLQREQYLPKGWDARHGLPDEEDEDFDAQLERVMERAVRYQAGQVARGM